MAFNSFKKQGEVGIGGELGTRKKWEEKKVSQGAQAVFSFSSLRLCVLAPLRYAFLNIDHLAPKT